MKKTFCVGTWKEGNLYVAQCLEIDVASQGGTEQEALENLREAIELHYLEPHATILPELRFIEAEIDA